MTESFDADWLALREAADHAARPEALVESLRAHLAGRRVAAPLEVTDLGSGTGSNLRYLAPRLPPPQHWRLVDHDTGLLGRAGAPGAGIELERWVSDLADDPAAALASGSSLVTGSALLDLVSEAWLDRLLAACAEQGAAVLFALSYDGRIRWSQPHALDAELEDAVNRHQCSDKGFGAALGPTAAPACAARLEGLGYGVQTCASDWRIDAHRAGLGAALIDGWVAAASAIDPGRAADLRAWGKARAVALARGEVELTVGHQDVLGLR
ncbi:hypothetical protein [Thioalkalivibrio sp. AKL12]|uniref:hypothetical protein n=1 Tax=Thioalkalivibrio sp. AKL12 TaxID=1158159 RepID=UPI00036A72D1|nr:hypothetical protein [Thioalkalivibrio sp. AKL12]